MPRADELDAITREQGRAPAIYIRRFRRRLFAPGRATSISAARHFIAPDYATLAPQADYCQASAERRTYVAFRATHLSSFATEKRGVYRAIIN